MLEKLVHIGFKNYLSPDRIVAVAAPSSAPIKRNVRNARDREMTIDMTNGRRMKSVVFTDSGHLVLSALDPATINNRLKDGTEE